MFEFRSCGSSKNGAKTLNNSKYCLLTMGWICDKILSWNKDGFQENRGWERLEGKRAEREQYQIVEWLSVLVFQDNSSFRGWTSFRRAHALVSMVLTVGRSQEVVESEVGLRQSQLLQSEVEQRRQPTPTVQQSRRVDHLDSFFPLWFTHLLTRTENRWSDALVGVCCLHFWLQ